MSKNTETCELSESSFSDLDVKEKGQSKPRASTSGKKHKSSTSKTCKKIESRRLSESSSDSGVNEKVVESVCKQKQRSTSAGKQRKRQHIAPVSSVNKPSTKELFGTDSEEENDDAKQSAVKPRDKKRPVPSPSPHTPSESERKKAKPSPAAIVKPSARDVFGTDSDDDEIDDANVVGKKPSSIASYFNKRIANGLARQSDPMKTGSHFIELKVYKCDEIKHVQPMNRWRHAIITVKNRTDDDTEAWRHLTKFIKATRQEFKDCRPDIIISSVPSASKLIDNTEILRCKMCKVDVHRYDYKYHLRTNVHKSNSLQKTEFDNINIVASAFRNRIVTYRLNCLQNDFHPLPERFLDDNRINLTKLLNKTLAMHECIKVNFELFAYFMLPKSDEQHLKSFNTKYQIVCKSSNLNTLLSNAKHDFKTKLAEFEQCESGWMYVSVSHLEINVNKYCPMRGGSGTYVDLPFAVKKSRSCINLKNQDNHCFLWCIVAKLFPAKTNVSKVSSYPHYSTVLNIEGMSFPPTLDDIRLFEKNNPNISINIYGLHNNSRITGPLYLTKKRQFDHVNLLYIENYLGMGHYCLIKDIVRLVRRQVTRYKGKMYLCESCLQFFNNEPKYKSHNCSHVLTILPQKHSILRFKNFERQQKINFVIYADFECLLENHEKTTSENCRIMQSHVPSCFGYYICCSHDSSLNKYVSYRGIDCVEVFIKRLTEDATWIRKILLDKKPMAAMTVEQKMQYRTAKECHICKQLLFDDKVRDHDHVTSEYRGAAHSHCNLMHRVCPFIPVVLHNLSGYDSHLFIGELAKYVGPIKIIPKSKEYYLSISKEIFLGKDQIGSERMIDSVKIKFIDSFQFLSAGIDELSKSLSDTDFCNLSREFKDKGQLQLLRQKGVYPYDYMDSWLKFEEKQLPHKSKFYNRLNDESISNEQYEFARTVWDNFNIKTIGEYTDLYLKCDVLLLCDIFEKFRTTALLFYKLDPAYYVTSSSLSWDSMLLYTRVELELINDLEMYQMLEKGIRGGLAQCSLRHAKASNKYLPNYDESKPSSYLIYLDCNNLYGYAMTKKYPICNFRFLETHEIESFEISNVMDDSEIGFILEVDLRYPEHLHDMHSDLPFAAEKFKPRGSKSEKLIANLYDKFNYVIHYVHLKECLKNGLELMKIHRILSFRQDDYLKKYIDLNTSLRQFASTKFEKDLFKLLNNAIFGKTIENKRKQVEVKLVTTWNDTRNTTNKNLGAEKLITKPNMNSITIFSENFVAIQLNHEKIVLDRPIYIGFSVLEYAKQHMYKFHYGYIKKKYKDRVHLCYTDTDSLLYLIYTYDFYQDMRHDLHRFDSSNFELNNIYNIKRTNEKIPGKFKDELGGVLIEEFIGLRAKLYCIDSVKTSVKKAKGITKSVTKRLKMVDYSDALRGNIDNNRKCKMNLIRSIKHHLYTQQVDKQIFSSNDDKRQVLRDRIHTLPWGHCDTIF